MAGPGGGGTTTSTTSSELPPEFRPLFNTAVPQIQAVQEALPLADFAQANPQGIAPLSDFQAGAFNLLPSLLSPTSGLQSLQSLTGPTNTILSNTQNVGSGALGGSQAALDALAASGRVGSVNLGGGQQATPTIQDFGVGETVLPGVSQGQISSSFLPIAPGVNPGVPQGAQIGIPPGLQGQLDSLNSRIAALQGQQPTGFGGPIFRLSQPDAQGHGQLVHTLLGQNPTGNFFNLQSGQIVDTGPVLNPAIGGGSLQPVFPS